MSIEQDVEAHIASERDRYNRQFQGMAVGNLAWTGWHTAITPLERLDDILLRRFRGLWKLCRYAVMTYERDTAT